MSALADVRGVNLDAFPADEEPALPLATELHLELVGGGKFVDYDFGESFTLDQLTEVARFSPSKFAGPYENRVFATCLGGLEAYYFYERREGRKEEVVVFHYSGPLPQDPLPARA